MREFSLESRGLPPPGQARGEHIVGVGVDREMTGGKDAGKDGRDDPAENHEQGAAAAAVDEAEEQALKGHGKPNSREIRAAKPAHAASASASPRIADGNGDSRFAPTTPSQNAALTATDPARPAVFGDGGRRPPEGNALIDPSKRNSPAPTGS